jgi:nitrogen regulatory protein PII
MKMIWAIISPAYMHRVIDALARAGFGGMTRLPFRCPGGPEPAGPDDGAPKSGVLMIAVPDNLVPKAVTVIRAHARPEGSGGNDNDEPASSGRIFVTRIDESFTIRTSPRDRQREAV